VLRAKRAIFRAKSVGEEFEREGIVRGLPGGWLSVWGGWRVTRGSLSLKFEITVSIDGIVTIND
jgi:hypothetical protein